MPTFDAYPRLSRHGQRDRLHHDVMRSLEMNV